MNDIPVRKASRIIFTSYICLCGKVNLIKEDTEHHKIVRCQRCEREWKLEIKELF